MEEAESEVARLAERLQRQDDPAARERLVVLLAELGREAEALAQLQPIIRRLPSRAKGWRAIAAAVNTLPSPQARADVWRAALGFWTSLGEGEAADAFGADLATRLLRRLGETMQQIDPADPDSIDAAWRLARSLYADPAFGALAVRHPDAFTDFVRLSGKDPHMKAAVAHGADLSPCVVDAIALHGAGPYRSQLRTICREEMSAAHDGLEVASEQAERLLDDATFQGPVVICGFHHSGTRLLARQLEALGLRQRINLYQYEWTYVVQLNSILEPGCMDPARLGQGGEDASMLSPRRLAFRMALAGLEPGQAWGFKDPRNGLTARAWLQAFPQARIVHLMRDPVSTLGTLPAEYDRFVRLDERRPTAVRFWMELWEAYVEAARAAMAAASVGVEIRFEDLCADPAGVLRQVTATLGLEAEVGGEVLAAAPVDPAKADLRERVRKALGAADFAALTALGARYGY